MSETQAELGAEMQAARRAHGWELPQLAASLRIRQSYLEAIEAGRLADLPGTTYALGFVRAYASALGLPGEEMARRFRADATLANGQTALRFPAPVPQRGLPAGALMLLGVFILAASYGGWYWITEHRATPVETVPPIPDAMVSETQKPVPSPQVASLLPNTAPPAPAPTPAAPAAVTTPAASGSPASGTTSSAPSATGLSAAGANGPTASGPPAGARGGLDQASPSGAASLSTGNAIAAGGNPTAPTAAAPPGPAATVPADGAQGAAAPPGLAAAQPSGTRVVVRATADAWVTVKQKSGPPLLNKLMHTGESWPLPAGAEGASLTTGNAGGTQIDVDGAPIPTSLGGSGAVRRDVPLDADMLKAGKLPPPRVRVRATPAED